MLEEEQPLVQNMVQVAEAVPGLLVARAPLHQDQAELACKVVYQELQLIMQVEVVAALIMHLVDRAASVEMVAVAMAALTPLDLLEL
jgi:hypothetical protein